MTKQEFENIISTLSEAFSVNFNPIKTAVYAENLGDLDYQKVKIVLKKLIQTSDFLPKIATIRREYQAMNQKVLSEFDTYTIIQKAISQHGIYHTEEALEQIRKSSPELYEIVKRIGFREICMAPETMMQQKISKIHEFYKKAQQNGLSQNLSLQIETVKGQIKQEGLKLLCETENEIDTDSIPQKTSKQNNSCSLGDALKELEKHNPRLCKYASSASASNLKLKEEGASL